MPLRDPKPESHVLAAAAAQESTIQILNSVPPRTVPAETPAKAVGSSFIEDVEQWVNNYLSLADEVLESPAEPEPHNKKRAA